MESQQAQLTKHPTQLHAEDQGEASEYSIKVENVNCMYEDGVENDKRMGGSRIEIRKNVWKPDQPPISAPNTGHKRFRSRSPSQRFEQNFTSSSDTGEKEQRKADPDSTPKELETAEEILALKNCVKRLTELNFRLQERMNKLDDERDDLLSRLNKCEDERHDLLRKLNDLETVNGQLKDGCSCNHFKPQDTQTTTHTVTRNSSFYNGNESNNPACSVEMGYEKKLEETDDFNQGFLDFITSEVEHTSGRTKRNNMRIEENDVTVAQNFCEVIVSDPKKETDLPSDTCDGISLILKDIIEKIPSGVKRDIKFIKELSIVTFGPEVLAGSSILGTKKGLKGKDQEGRIARPALDKTKLEFVRVKLAERIKEEENIELEQARAHDRCTNKRVNDALRDAQKWCRQRGYGLGIKSNTIDEDFLALKAVNKI